VLLSHAKKLNKLGKADLIKPVEQCLECLGTPAVNTWLIDMFWTLLPASYSAQSLENRVKVVKKAPSGAGFKIMRTTLKTLLVSPSFIPNLKSGGNTYTDRVLQM
jgi:hypothetical protein